MFSKTTINRWIFIIISVSIISLILWNTFLLFNQLKENERSKMQVWAEAQKEFNEQIDLEGETSNLITVTLASNTTTPMIVYIHKEDVYTARNIKNEDNLTPKEVKNYIEEFKTEYKPIDVDFDGEVLQTVYYGNSSMINKLKYYPAVLILILLLSFGVLYFFYKTSKSAEQNKLWAGMAKETAHQIGTPLSSLVGWTEILKTENVNEEYIVEIEKDVDRLRTITERFSKVGSVPTLEKRELVEETKAAFDYLKRRSSKLIEFSIHTPKEPLFVELNEQLFGWVVENLVKNGIDAMRGRGSIHVEIVKNAKYALIQVTDSGKGIPKNLHKRIFTPGFTTKKRGWGLGLSLARRIVVEYHNGKIRVLKSVPGKGTTIEIALRLLDT